MLCTADPCVHYISPFAVVSLDALMASRDEARPLDIAAPFSPIEDRLEAAEATKAVNHFVDGLTDKQQDILRRVFWYDQSQATVARAYGVSEAAISKSIQKIYDIGRRKLTPYRNARLSLHAA